MVKKYFDDEKRRVSGKIGIDKFHVVNVMKIGCYSMGFINNKINSKENRPSVANLERLKGASEILIW